MLDQFDAATDVLTAAARKQGTSLNRYVTALLHEHALLTHTDVRCTIIDPRERPNVVRTAHGGSRAAL